jgi:pimeloyl-ACP methyl ester carboxylesterase
MRFDRQSPLPTASGTTAHGTAYRRHGHGRPVVLIHGVGMNQQVWEPQLAALASRFEVITFDMLGHGQSELPPSEAKLAHYTEQVRQLLDDLGLPAAAIVGHSMGALVAIDFAVRHPERCLALVAMNAVFCRTDGQRQAVMQRAAALRDVGSDANVADTLRRWFGEPVPEALHGAAELSRSMLKGVRPVGYARTYMVFASADAEHASSLRSLRMPALFTTGDGDPNSTPAMSRAMAEQVAGAELAILPDTRHMMSLTDPQRVNALLIDFLQRTLS